MNGPIEKPDTAREKKQRIVAMGLSVSISTLLMALKFYTFWLTNSTAILSDALESIINVVASSFALWSILLAAKPPDRSHPYGHGKVEFFSAGFEGALIIFASGAILWEALPGIWHPKSLPMKSVSVNGNAWTDFDPVKEVISLHDLKGTVKVESTY